MTPTLCPAASRSGSTRRRRSTLFAGYVALCLAGLSAVVALGLVAVREEPRRSSGDCPASVRVDAPQAGIVKSVRARAGMRVEAGQPLFEIDDGTAAALRRELIALRQAMADYSAARAELSRTATRWADGAESVSAKHEALYVAHLALTAAEVDLAASAARIHSLLARRERLVVRAPRAGYVLQVHVRRGESTPQGMLLPVVRLGHIDCTRTLTATRSVQHTA